MTKLASVQKTEIAEADQPSYNDAAMRVNATRWAALPAVRRRCSRNWAMPSSRSLVTQRQSSDVAALGPFQRWTDPAWRRMSVAVR